MSDVINKSVVASYDALIASGYSHGAALTMVVKDGERRGANLVIDVGIKVCESTAKHLRRRGNTETANQFDSKAMFLDLLRTTDAASSAG